jgi:hypothetical protein
MMMRWIIEMARIRTLVSAVLIAMALAAVALAAPGGAWARERPDSLVTGFDLETCLADYAPGFQISRMSPVWGAGLEALAVEPVSREILHLTVGVFGSSREAAEAATARVADSSIRLDTGSLAGKHLGDASWSADLTVLFQRDNVLVQVFGSSRDRVEAMAVTVDRELAGKEGRIERGSRVSRPTISGIRRPAGDIAIGAEAEIRLSGYSPAGRTVFYTYLPEGGELVGGDPPLPLQFRPSSPGAHVLRFAAVDARCVMSLALELPLTAVEGTN